MTKCKGTREETDCKPVYDLEGRRACFGEAVIDFAKTIPREPVTDRIISQLVGAGTSIGANYIEADEFRLEKRISQVRWHLQEGGA